MPHVEIRGSRNLADFHQNFRPRSWEEDGVLYKAVASYLDHEARAVLVECLVVEDYLRQSFFVLLSLRAEGVMVRLLPRTSPEKTAGVRRCLAWIASWVLRADPTACVGATNLEAFLHRPFPSEALAP